MLSVNLVFASNLRKLVEQRGSQASAAQALDLGKVQLQRYLRGESFPKPAVLKRICDHFGTDARILTEPLGRIADTASAPPDAPMLAALDYVMALRTPGDTAPPLPDGVYQVWRRSLARPDKIALVLHRVFRVGTVQVVRCIDPLSFLQVTTPVNGRPAPARPGASAIRLREHRGLLLQARHGYSILKCSPYPDRTVGFHYLTPNPEDFGLTWVGYYALGRPMMENRRRLAAEYWLPLGHDWADLMRARRMGEWIERDALPDTIRSWLDRALDF